MKKYESSLIKSKEIKIDTVITEKTIQISRLNKSLYSLKKDLKGRPKQYEVMAAGYINKIKEFEEDEKV